MTIQVHFYSIAKDCAGQAARPLLLPDHVTVADALERLIEEVPTLAPIRASCLYAIGTQYASMDAPLADGDVMSVIPPMQGG